MNPVLKHIAQAAEIVVLIVCAAFLIPFYFVWARREITRVGF